MKRSWKKKKKIYPGKRDICKTCGSPKEWELQNAHDRESSLLLHLPLLRKKNSSGIVSESRYQLVSRWIIDLVYIWVSDKFAYSDPQQ